MGHPGNELIMFEHMADDNAYYFHTFSRKCSRWYLPCPPPSLHVHAPLGGDWKYIHRVGSQPEACRFSGCSQTVPVAFQPQATFKLCVCVCISSIHLL